MHRWLLAFLLVPAVTAAQTNPAAQSARLWRQQHERAIVNEFVTLLAVPNVSSDKANIQRNAELVAKMIRGARPRREARVGAGRQPGRRRARSARRARRAPSVSTRTTTASRSTRRNGPRRRSSRRCATRPLEDGGTPVPLPAAGSPFDPESRLYARGAGDDKAPIVAMLTALDAIRAAGLRMKSNIKLAFEGEEEMRARRTSRRRSRRTRISSPPTSG